MVRGMYKSRTMVRYHVRVPSGETRLRFRKRATAKPSCGSCGSVLPGVPRARVNQLRKLAKTERRPERPFGGVLCSKCLRLEMLKRERSMAQ